MRSNERVNSLTSEEEVQQDYEEFGVEEILGQYMSNPYAEQIVRAHIKDLEEENLRLETEISMLR